MKKRLVALVVVAVLSVVANDASGVVQYTITDLGTLGGTDSEAYGISDSGQVVGEAYLSGNSCYHAFLYSGSGPMEDLGTLGGTYSSAAYGINNSGQVVGWASTSRSLSHAFLKSGSGPMQDLGTLGGTYSWAYGINDSGQVVGGATTSGGDYHAFLKSGPMQDLGTLGGRESGAYGINDSGQVVGEARTSSSDPHAFLKSGGGSMQDLGALGGTVSGAYGINNSGQVVGYAYTSGNAAFHAFLKSGSGPMQDLGTLGGTSSSASGINDSGQVVGGASTSGDAAYHAFLYSGSGPVQDLNNLISASSGWTVTVARAINDKGQIVGHGTNPAGQTHAFLLTPLPKTYAILVGSHAPSGGNPDGVRGDLDVANVAAKLTWATEVTTIVYNNWNAADTVATDIQSAISAVAAKAKPGDSLIFFYAGHGSGASGQGVEDFINGVQGSSYQDDTLTSLLADQRFSGVKKWVLLDSCHSEGFWKNDSATDNDLQTLSNISFLSAATEDEWAYSDSSRNYTGFFTNAILPGIKPDATFSSLLALAQTAYPDTVTGYFRDDGYGTGEWHVASGMSPDFDPNGRLDGEVVPEPSTLILLGVAAISLLVYAWQRRKQAA